jgi:hypothetical protein
MIQKYATMEFLDFDWLSVIKRLLPEDHPERNVYFGRASVAE